ncbi:hypothetical protein R1A27_32565 (plasmid) [Methylobacterium sp. NMS12]|uniref:hypothetical protein n=1 Tax=Methylobacterium sp. NMS12 TaxID=3079766 RepID=UPI003F8819F5
MKSGSVRGEQLVQAWNCSNIEFVLDQLADDIVLEARLPKMPARLGSLRLKGKMKFALGLRSYPKRLPAFSIISMMEDPHTICLVLEDADHDLLAVTIELNAHGKFERIISYRSGSRDLSRT